MYEQLEFKLRSCMRFVTNMLTAPASIVQSWKTGTVESYSRKSEDWGHECRDPRRGAEIQLTLK